MSTSVPKPTLSAIFLLCANLLASASGVDIFLNFNVEELWRKTILNMRDCNGKIYVIFLCVELDVPARSVANSFFSKIRVTPFQVDNQEVTWISRQFNLLQFKKIA